MIVSGNVDLDKSNKHLMNLIADTNSQVGAARYHGNVAVETNPDVGWVDPLVVDGPRANVVDHR